MLVDSNKVHVLRQPLIDLLSVWRQAMVVVHWGCNTTGRYRLLASKWTGHPAMVGFCLLLGAFIFSLKVIA